MQCYTMRMHRKIFPPLMRLTFLWLVLAVFSGLAFGGDLAYRPVNGGLQMSLTTNGYQFEVGTPLQPTKVKKGPRASATKVPSLVASVALANRGSVAVPFTFAHGAAAERKFRFKVFTEDGTQIWESEPDAAGGSAAVEAKLEKRSPWRRTVQVPLSIGGSWLASGRYTLEASVDAEGGPGATAVFEVVNGGAGYIPAPPNTGILGKVVEVSMGSNTETTPATEVPVGGAQVRVEEILPPGAQTLRAPFTWYGMTDAEGNFRAPTISGRFKVTASRLTKRPMATNTGTENLTAASGLVREGAGVGFIGIPELNTTSLPAVAEVEVPLGQFVSTTLKIPHFFLSLLTLPQKVYSVDEVHVEYRPTAATPGMLQITANGTVSSGGWSNAQLVHRNFPVGMINFTPFFSVDVLEFDLIATPPTGAATTVMSPISASTQIPVPAEVREIRVYSRNNSQSVLLP